MSSIYSRNFIVYLTDKDEAAELRDKWCETLVGNEDYISNNIVVSERLAEEPDVWEVICSVFQEATTKLIFDEANLSIEIVKEN